MGRTRYEIVREALLGRRTLVAVYDGLHRELCPWALGTKDGRERGLFYQRAGMTSHGPVVPGSPNNWRCMDLDRLEILEVVDRPWEGPTGHRRASGCLDVIDVDHSAG